MGAVHTDGGKYIHTVIKQRYPYPDVIKLVVDFIRISLHVWRLQRK